MKISLWHLQERLLEYTPTANIADGQCSIQGARVLSLQNHSFFSDYVYLVNLDPQYGWAASQDTVILIHQNDMLILHHATFYDVLNNIMDIFDYFRTIEQKLETACKSNQPYENMVSILHDYYHLPIVIANNNLKVLAATEDIAAIKDGWDIIFETHYMPITFFSIFNNEDNNHKFITRKKPFLMDPANPSAAKYYRKLFVIPFETHQVSAGKVLINLFEDTLSPGNMLMGEIFASYFSKILPANEDPYHKTAYFEKAVLQGYYSESELYTIYSIQHWTAATNFYLCVIASSCYPLTLPELRWCCGILELNLQNALAFTVDGRIVLLLPEPQSSPVSTLDHVFHNYIPGFAFQCGISLMFHDFRCLHRYYSQGVFALQQLQKNAFTFMYFQECGFQGSCMEISNVFDWEIFFPQELQALETADSQQNTEYYHTFFCYLQNNQHLQQTATELHIHTNTLKYRLRKIFAALDYKPDQTEKNHYYLLCMQMKAYGEKQKSTSPK